MRFSTANFRLSAMLVGVLLVTALAALTFAAGAVAQPAPNAQPAGGVVVGGIATIAQTASATTVTQTSQRAAIKWQSFDVGSQQSVDIQQPNARAITLMTVTGPNPSEVAGRITSNGQVILVNQSGIAVLAGAQVDAAGLGLASAAARTNQFITGAAIKLSTPGKPSAQVSSAGQVTIAGGGTAFLLAPEVANTGKVVARLGHVFMLAGMTGVVSIYGNNLVSATIGSAVTTAPNPAAPLVSQAGTVIAAGGKVQLAARAAAGVVADLIATSGSTTAPTAASRRGQIVLKAVGGSISGGGTISALGSAAGTAGGQVQLLADADVDLASTAIVNVSGRAGGGTIALGTNLKRANGGPSVPNPAESKDVDVPQGAKVFANATGSGNGGRVAVLSSNDTTFAGKGKAMGGPSGGNGGTYEISAGNVLTLKTTPNVTAPKGMMGTILLDPRILIW